MIATEHVRAIREAETSIRSELARVVHGVDGLAVQAVLDRIIEHADALAGQNAGLEAQVEEATRETALAHEARAAAESREAACHQLIEDIVKHFHQRDRHIAEAMHANHTYMGLLSRAMHVESASHKGLQVDARRLSDDMLPRLVEFRPEDPRVRTNTG